MAIGLALHPAEAARPFVNGFLSPKPVNANDVTNLALPAMVEHVGLFLRANVIANRRFATLS